MDNEDKALLRDSLDGIVRDQRHRLGAALSEFGWHELLAEEPGPAVSMLMELTGRHLADHRTLDAVLLHALADHAGPGGSGSGAAGSGAAPGSGELPGPATAVVHPLPAASEPTSTLEDGRLLVLRGLVAARPAPPERVVVPALDKDRLVVATAPWRGAWPQAGTGVDPDAGFSPLEGVVRVEPTGLVSGAVAGRLWRRLRAAAHRALAHQLVGVGSAMAELAVDHVRSRTQFGRPLASFQAVKHRLADVRLWQECAQLAADAAWEAVTEPDEHVAAALAKCTANRFTRLAREHCQQVLGGMGFTWEHDLHRFVRRALVLEPWFGSTAQLQTGLGIRIREDGAAPRLAPL